MAPRSIAPLPRLTSFRTGAPKTTRVHVGRGAIDQLAHVDAPLGLDPDARHVLITDSRVDVLHGRRLRGILRERGLDVAYVVVPEGEATKSLDQYVALIDRVLELGADERSTMISLGGGVVCNLTGMIAATLFRGVRLVHLPTTLMSQADAAIGHKQAVNGAKGKNLVGAYYAPDLIWVDPNTLQTLEERWVRDGFAEVLKHALAQDPSLLALVSDPAGTLADLDFVTEVIERTVALKCATIDADPLERDQAMVLQYGHTVGHAVEHAAGYALGHGEAVAVGMVAAARVASAVVGAPPELVELHRTLLQRWSLPTAIDPRLDPEVLIDRVRRGKRCTGETVWMALADAPGRLARHADGRAWPVPLELLAELLGWRSASATSGPGSMAPAPSPHSPLPPRSYAPCAAH